MKATIVSTYPEHGSKNVGDALITDSVVRAIKEERPEAHIKKVWRQDCWKNVKDDIQGSDHIFFACLAIRKKMTKVYPYLSNILAEGVPFSIISAGTDLPVELEQAGQKVYKDFSKEDIDLLKEIDERCYTFGTRGVLSQRFCERIGLKNSWMSGDIAFSLPQGEPTPKFSTPQHPKKILISDPHRAKAHLRSLEKVVEELKNAFGKVEIIVVQHGLNKIVEDFCLKKGINTVQLYPYGSEALDIYGTADLHVGFRVHGHVSALKRGVPSYLLEQDGRGADYGATLDVRTSVPHFTRRVGVRKDLKSVARFFLKGKPSPKVTASIYSVEMLMAILKKDFEEGFLKFNCLSKQIEGFSEYSRFTIKKALQE